jgi:hypothetical protein
MLTISAQKRNCASPIGPKCTMDGTNKKSHTIDLIHHSNASSHIWFASSSPALPLVSSSSDCPKNLFISWFPLSLPRTFFPCYHAHSSPVSIRDRQGQVFSDRPHFSLFVSRSLSRMRGNGNCGGNTVRSKNHGKKEMKRFFGGSEELETKGTVGGDDEDKMVAVSSRISTGEWIQYLMGLIECERLNCIGLKESLPWTSIPRCCENWVIWDGETWYDIIGYTSGWNRGSAEAEMVNSHVSRLPLDLWRRVIARGK